MIKPVARHMPSPSTWFATFTYVAAMWLGHRGEGKKPETRPIAESACPGLGSRSFAAIHHICTYAPSDKEHTNHFPFQLSAFASGNMYVRTSTSLS